MFNISFFGQCSPKDTNNKIREKFVTFNLEHNIENHDQVPCLCSPGEKCQLCVNSPASNIKIETRDLESKAKLTPEFILDYITNEGQGKYKTLKLMSLGTLTLHFINIFIIIVFLVIIIVVVISNNIMSRHCNN